MNRSTLVLLTTLVLLAGCASYDGAPDTEKSARLHTKSYKDEHGLYIVGQVLTRTESKESYLGSTFPSNEYIPVILRVANGSENGDEYSLKIEDLSLQSSEKQQFEQVDARDVLDESSYSAWRSSFFWLLAMYPGYLVLDSVWKANDAMRLDWTQKALGDTNVPAGPDYDLRGMVLFRLASGDELKGVDLGELSLKVRLDRSNRTEPGGLVEETLLLQDR